MAYSYINFRSTSGYVSDDAGDTYCINDVYPTTRGGFTFGWQAAQTAGNSSTTDGAHLAGRNFGNGSNSNFRLDLPDGPGTYRLRIAMGRLSGNVALQIRDNDRTTGTILATIGSTALASTTQFCDATGVVRTSPSDWTTNNAYVELVVTSASGTLWFNRTASVNNCLNCIGWELQSTPLSDATFTDEAGKTVTEIYSQEPDGKRMLKISSPSGTQTFTIEGTGTLDSYVDIKVDGSDIYIISAAPIPHDEGSGTIKVEQDTGTQQHTTTFTLDVIDVGDRSSQTGQARAMPSRDYLIHKTVADQPMWEGWQGQALTSLGTVSSAAAFSAAINAASPDGSTWYEIKVATGGDWTATISNNFKDFNSSGGGLLVRSVGDWSGQAIESLFTNFRPKGIEFRDVNFSGSDTNGTGQITLSTPANSSELWDIKFKNCYIGRMWLAGETVDDYAGWGDFIRTTWARNVIIEDCYVNGLSNFAVLQGIQYVKITGTEKKNVIRDSLGISGAYYSTTPINYFADPDNWYLLTDEFHIHQMPDIWDNFTSANFPHGDYCQIRLPDTTAVVRTGWMSFNNGAVYCTGDTTVPGTDPESGTNPGRQMFINSSQGYGYTFNIAFNNCLLVGSSARGLDSGDGVLCAYRCTMAGPGHTPNNAEYAMELQYTDGGSTAALYVKDCIIAVAVGNGSTTYYSDENNVLLSLAAGASSPNRPSDILRNAADFFTSVDTRYKNYPLTDDGSLTLAEFLSAFSKILHTSNGGTGARFTETHELTVDTNTISITIS